MAQLGFIVRALIASPSDVQKERQAIPEVIAAWNATHSLERRIIIEPVKWESHAVPGLEGRPQEMVNKQLVDICDFLIGVFWTRLGTPTGVAPSGTAEEINEFREAGKPVLLYFSSQPVVPESIDPKQYEMLKSFRAEMEQLGLIERYSEVGELREKLTRHLTSVVNRLVDTSQIDVALVGLPAEHTSTTDGASAIQEFREQFRTFVRRFSADWSSERDSEPNKLDQARSILASAADENVTFASHMGTGFDESMPNSLQEFAKRLKVASRHQVYLDGGVSWRAFWQQGDEIARDMEKFASDLR